MIIEVRYLNGDAKDAFEEKVEEHKVEGMDLEKGIRILTETAIEKGYLKEGAPVTVGVEIIEDEAVSKPTWKNWPKRPFWQSSRAKR